MIFVARLCLRAGHHFAVGAVDRVQGQKIAGAHHRNIATQDGSAAGALANLPSHLRSETCVFRQRHQGKGLSDTLVREQVEERGLLQLDEKSLPQRAVEDRIASHVGELGEYHGIVTSQLWGGDNADKQRERQNAIAK